MNKKRKTLFEGYLKKYGVDASLIGELIDTVVNQEKRIIKLEENQ